MKIEIILDDSCIPFDGTETLPMLAQAIRTNPKFFILAADTLRITSPEYGSYSEER